MNYEIQNRVIAQLALAETVAGLDRQPINGQAPTLYCVDINDGCLYVLNDMTNELHRGEHVTLCQVQSFFYRRYRHELHPNVSKSGIYLV